MLQRSPSYVVTLPGQDPLATFLSRFLPPRVRYPIVRWKNVLLTQLFFQLSRRRPQVGEGVRPQRRRAQAAARLPDRSRISGRSTTRGTSASASSPTATCSRRSTAATPRSSPTTSRPSPRTGSRSPPGEELEADVIVTATGLNMQLLGGDGGERRRRARRSGRDGRLQGDDAERRAERGDGARLHERLLDAQVRPLHGVRLPPPEPHGRERPRRRDACGPAAVRAARADHRPQVGLRDAVHRQGAQAGRAHALAPAPELPARHPHAAGEARSTTRASSSSRRPRAVASRPRPAAAPPSAPPSDRRAASRSRAARPRARATRRTRSRRR